jgi:ribonucleoside-triphosphate reductase
MQFMTGVINEFIVRDKVACASNTPPAENAGIKLARADVKWAKARGRDIFVQGADDNVFLTSGCMLPFSEEISPSKSKNAAEFQGYATSGSILHHFIESEIEPEILSNYLQNVFKKPINYLTRPDHHQLSLLRTKLVAKDARTIEICPSAKATTSPPTAA